MTLREYWTTEPRRHRIVGWSLIVFGLLSIGSLAFRQRVKTAVSSYDSHHGPARLTDGRQFTFWAPKEDADGIVAFRLPARRFVTRVGLLNARSRYQRKYATQEYVIRLYSGDELVTQISGAFDNRLDEPTWVWRTVESEDIDRIELELTGAPGHTAGLSEFRYE